jgi:hypothetical protein
MKERKSPSRTSLKHQNGQSGNGAFLFSDELRNRLLFPKHEAVDGLWSTIAQSVATGPLKDAGVFLTKVAPTPSSAGDFVSLYTGTR